MSSQTKPVEKERIFDPNEEPTGEEGDVVTLFEPNLETARWGAVQELWRLRRHRKKRRRLAKKGYVQWYLVGSNWPSPKFVKPESHGGGMLELKHDGERYLFPRSALVPSVDQGMWTVIHKRGEADPLNLQDPSRNPIPTDELEQYLNTRVMAKPPGLLDKLDIDSDDVVKYGLAMLFLLIGLQAFMGGGF